MPGKTKVDHSERERKDDATGASLLKDDQEHRAYYYDDACGYEAYLPDDDEDEEIGPGSKEKETDL